MRDWLLVVNSTNYSYEQQNENEKKKSEKERKWEEGWVKTQVWVYTGYHSMWVKK